MVMGMIYITIVYKVYRWDTFINDLEKAEEAMTFFDNWTYSTSSIKDHVFLLIIDVTYLVKAFVQLRLLPVIGPTYVMLKMLMKELLIFAIFFGLLQFVFSIMGNLLFHDLASYATLTESMLTIFKASAGVFDNAELAEAK